MQKLLVRGFQLLRIAWREEPTKWKKKYFAVLSATASVKLCIIFHFKKKWQAKEKTKVMPTFSLMREILHAWWDVLRWCGRFYMFGMRAWEIVSRRKTHTQCMRIDSPVVICTRLPFYTACPRKSGPQHSKCDPISAFQIW